MSATHIFIPFICLAVNAFIQIFIFRFFPKVGLLRSLFLGFICGFLVILLTGSGVILANNLIIYVLLGYCYFHFVNMGETARRIRILLELKGSRTGLSLDEILERYNSRDIIERRLARLVTNGQVICKNGRYYIGNPAMLTIARSLTVVKQAVFGKSKAPQSLIMSAAIFILGGLVYLNSLLNLFVWDDVILVLGNLHIRNLAYIPRLFIENIYHQEMTGCFYRPILISTFALDFRFWGLEPFGYHLTNIILHLSTSVLVYYFISRIVNSQKIAFLTALFFVLHPIQTEAVTYISGRADLLAAFFCISSLVFFSEYLRGGGWTRRLYYAASVLCFLLGLLSKETAAIFPLVFILYESCFGDKKFKLKDLVKYLPIAGVLCAYVFIRSELLANVKNASLVGDYVSLSGRLLSIPPVIMTYLKLLVFPVNLHMERMDYVFDYPASFFDHRVIVSALFLSLIGIFIWLNRKRSRVVFFGFFWFILNLLPVLNIVPINAFVAEHWLYLPSIGFFLIAATVCAKLLEFKYLKLYITVILIDIFLFFGALTIRQNYVWRNPVTFYRYTLKYSPQSARLHTNLGIIYFDLKLYKEAESEYLEALRIQPVGPGAAYTCINLGTLYDALDKKGEAVKAYKRAIELMPGNPLPYNYAGQFYYMQGKYKEAIKLYKKSVELAPTNASFWSNLGMAYLKAGLKKEAIACYKKGINLYPYEVVMHENLGSIYAEKGDLKKALEEYKVAMELAPDNPLTYLNIGNVCARMGAYEQAKYFWKKALEINPTYTDAKMNLEKLEKESSRKNKPRK